MILLANHVGHISADRKRVGAVLGQYSIDYVRVFLFIIVDDILVLYHDILDDLCEPDVVLMDIGPTPLVYMKQA